MGQTADELRAQIAGTRADMSTTLDAMGDRVSPKRVAQRQMGRVSERVGALRDTIMGSASDASDRLSNQAQGVTDTLQQGPDALRRKAQGNPLAAGLIAFGAGMLLASVLPASDTERQVASTLSEHAQPVIDQAQSAAQELKSGLQDSAQEAVGQVKQTATEAAQQVKDEASSSAQHVAGTAQGAAQEVQGQAQDSLGQSQS